MKTAAMTQLEAPTRFKAATIKTGTSAGGGSHGPGSHGPGLGGHGSPDHGSSHNADTHGHGDAPHVHVMPLSMLFTIFTALIVLTIGTVAASKFDLGPWEVPITMAIATTKAMLVAIYFMHLRYDNKFNAMIFFFSLFFVALFLGGTLLDVRQYQKDLIPPEPSAAAPATPAAAPATPTAAH